MLYGKKYHIYKYGCWMNDREAEVAAALLEKSGCVSADNPEDADILLFNTCCISERIERTALADISRYNGKFRIVSGCMSQRSAEFILAACPDVKIIIGTGQMHTLEDCLYQAIVSSEQVISALPPMVPDYSLPSKRASDVTAYVSIMNGCSNYCSYCIVPYVRGNAICRSSTDILMEIYTLVSKGYKDITLLGQNSLSYNFDGVDFEKLLRLTSDSGIERLRFFTSNPRDMNERILKTMADTPNICESLHLPAQSGSNAVLKSMNRGYMREHYIKIAERFYELMPDGSLTTDFIVGFPGETDEQYMETEDMYSRIHFDDSYLFIYSVRPGTKAASMGNQIDPLKQYERLSRLDRLKLQIRQKRANSFLKQTVHVLIEQQRGETSICRTDNGWYIQVDGDTTLKAGDMAYVLVTSSNASQLTGIFL